MRERDSAMRNICLAPCLTWYRYSKLEKIVFDLEAVVLQEVTTFLEYIRLFRAPYQGKLASWSLADIA